MAFCFVPQLERCKYNSRGLNASSLPLTQRYNKSGRMNETQDNVADDPAQTGLSPRLQLRLRARQGPQEVPLRTGLALGLAAGTGTARTPGRWRLE